MSMRSALFYTEPNIRTLQLTLFSVDLVVALVTLLLCIWLSEKRRELLNVTVFRVIFVLQFLGVAKGAVELAIILTDPRSNSKCRWLTYLSHIVSMGPLYLSVFCTLYFQLLLVNNVPPSRLWPKRVMVAGTLVFSLVPESFILFISPKTVGITTYCQYAHTFNTRIFVFRWLVSYIWVILASVIGVGSITATLISIVRKYRKVSSEITMSTMPIDAIYTSDQLRRSSSTLVVKTLVSIVWFPIMPIVSLWLAITYSIVRYKTQQDILAMDVLNNVFQFLEVPVMAMTFYTSPPVRRAYRKYRAEGRTGKPSTVSRTHDEVDRMNESQLRYYAAERDKMASQMYYPSLYNKPVQ
ncbi:hypothetical protein GQ54DRAFT_310698 [Martensiomyces pterosporus]|nr:hypothetical protein GQ54DRAFT_310698 [Martensiomyces pterosporus]